MHWTQNLCRTCGQISETCHSIYSNDVNSALEDKIKKCLNLNLFKGDYKPKQICDSCIVKLNEFSEFLETCYATNQKFETIYYNSQALHNKNFNYPQKQSVIVSNKQVPENHLDLELYKNTDIPLDNLNITNCQLNETDVLQLVGEENYSRETCDYVNDVKARSPYTTVLRHPSATEEFVSSNYTCEKREPSDTVGPKDKINYLKCENSYNLNNYSSKSFQGGTENFKRNTTTVDIVRNSIKQNSSKLGVTKKITKSKSHPCPHCEKTFSRRGTLNSHIANHTNIRPFKCEECSKSFAVKSELTTHRKVHGDQHKCKYCDKKFSVPSKLERHMRIHTNNKPFVCSVENCGKAFSDKRNLEGHKLMHTPEKNYSCPVCMKLFKTLNRLKQHSKCHTSGTMYTCGLCSKKYKYKSNLISHIKKHNNICPYCKVNCESNTILTHHVKFCRPHV